MNRFTAAVDYDVPIVNQSGETMPAHGVGKVSGYATIDGAEYVTLVKPNNSAGLYVVNGPVDLADDARGAGTRTFGALVKFDSGSPAVGQTWGPTNDWALESIGSGFDIVGGVTGTAVRAAIQSGEGAPTSVIVGRVNKAGGVAGGDATFAVNNVVLLSGTDPRATPGSSTENVVVTNTLAQTYGDNELIRAEQFEPAGAWHTDKVGSGTGDVFVEFELTEDLGYADVAKLAKPLKADRTLDSAAGDFYVLDSDAKWYGLAAYTSVAAAERGYRGWARFETADHAGSGKAGYEILWMERPAATLKVRLAADDAWAATSGEYNVHVDKSLAIEGRLPKEESGAFDVYADDPDKLAEKATEDDPIHVDWCAADAKYKVVSGPSAPQKKLEIGLVTLPIAAGTASGAATTITPGITADAVTLMDFNATPDGLSARQEGGFNAVRAGVNLSFTQLRATSTEPIAVVGYEQDVYISPSTVKGFVVVSLLDLRSLPGYVKGSNATADAQAAFHAGGAGGFQLDRDECP